LPAELDSCVQQVLEKDPTLEEENAYAICNAQLYGGSNFVTYNLDDKGDLYLKYFFADSSIAKGSAVGDFSLSGAALKEKDQEAVGLPFSILPSRELSLFGDYHPWSPAENATWDDHVNFARTYSPGHIVAVTANSQLAGAAQDVVSNGGRFAIVKITDLRAKDAYIKNPNLIPKAVSPGFMNLEAPNKVNISNFKWAHLAAVPMGAYGGKATLYASCLGGNTPCVNKLVAAGVVLRERTMNYCPVGASEALYNTSLINSDPTSSVNMSAQTTDSTNVNNTTAATSQPQIAKPSVAPVKQPLAAPTPKPTGVLRLKTQRTQPIVDPNNPNQQGQEGLAGQPKPVDTSKFEEMEKRVAEIEAREQYMERTKQIRNMIPMNLFVTKGKYNQPEHEAAIDEAAKSQWTDEMISKYYSGLLKVKEFEEAQDPKNNKNNFNVTPFGGSEVRGYTYQTQSSVPEIIGAAATAADMDLPTFRAQKVKNLVDMFHLGGRL
jgi:hypothetical protein